MRYCGLRVSRRREIGKHMNSSSVGNGSRANALWGRGGRGQRSRTVATRLGLLAAVTALAVPASGIAATRAASGVKNGPVVPAYLIQAATVNPLPVELSMTERVSAFQEESV